MIFKKNKDEKRYSFKELSEILQNGSYEEFFRIAREQHHAIVEFNDLLVAKGYFQTKQYEHALRYFARGQYYFLENYLDMVRELLNYFTETKDVSRQITCLQIIKERSLFENLLLADLYFGLKQYQNSLRALRDALLQEPNNEMIQKKMISCENIIRDSII